MKTNTSKGSVKTSYLITAYGRNGTRMCVVQTHRQAAILLDLLKDKGVTVTVVEVKKASHVTREYRAAAERHMGMVKVSDKAVKAAYPVKDVLKAYNAYLKDTRPGRVVQKCRILIGRHAA